MKVILKLKEKDLKFWSGALAKNKYHNFADDSTFTLLCPFIYNAKNMNKIFGLTIESDKDLLSPEKLGKKAWVIKRSTYGNVSYILEEEIEIIKENNNQNRES